MSKRVIKFGLSDTEIDRAIKELADYKQDIIQKTELLRQKVAERLAEEAKSGFSGAIVDDITDKSGGRRYANVDVSITDRGSVTVVVANGEDAVWVEFGAGVYHNGSPGSSPHPNGAELGMIIGGYGKGNGRKEKWGFYEDGELRITRGTPAVMPMSRAMNTICNEISEIMREVFG
jgi:hypothetical protein